LIGFVRKIKRLLDLSQRLEMVEVELNEIDIKVQKSINQYSKEFEKKIQKMTFDYTKNLDDTKSDYLKRYLEVRMDCIQNQVKDMIPKAFKQLQDNVSLIELRLEELKADEEE
jgi:DNA anti-recombination protein RmuC